MVTYPNLFPKRFEYSISNFGFFKINVVATDIKMSDIKINITDLDLDFMQSSIKDKVYVEDTDEWGWLSEYFRKLYSSTTERLILE